MARSIKLKNDTYWDNDSIDKHAITIALGGNSSVTTPVVAYDVNPLSLPNLLCKSGRYLTHYNNQSIKVEKDGYYIISAQSMMQCNNNTVFEMIVGVRVNGSNALNSYVHHENKNWLTFSLSPKIIHLLKGDIITLCFGTSITTQQTVTVAGAAYTYLTVRRL